LLAAGADPNAVGREGMSPLMYSARLGSADGVALLLQHKANPNTQTPDGVTPLMISNYEEKVRLLLEAGADIYRKDKNGKTAIFYAVEECAFDKVKLLVDKDPGILHAVDNDGRSVRSYLGGDKKCGQLRTYLAKGKLE
jgi:ankyrin repeat protein